jgi:hypothetical protein
MKFFSAALLAIGAAALHLKQEGGQGPPPMDGDGSGHDHSGGDREMPFPPPEDCGDKPEGEFSDQEIFDHIDANGSGDVDAQEGFNALYCAVMWGELEEEEAFFIYDFLTAHADMNPDGNPEALDFEEAMYAVNNLEEMMSQEDG